MRTILIRMCSYQGYFSQSSLTNPQSMGKSKPSNCTFKRNSCDCWKVDVMMFERVPMLFIVHEQTLFTMVRRKSMFRHPLDISEEITISCPWYTNTMEPTLGKNDNRKITGSINEMKRLTWGLYSPEQINSIEMSINQTLFSYLSHGKENYGNPFEAVESYAKGQTPWL